MAFSEPFPQLPAQDVPLVGKDGRINPIWWQWLFDLQRWLERLAASV
jgi:hypothetical protein